MLPEMKTHGQVITQTESLVIGVGSDSRFRYPLEIALGGVESARTRYMDVIHDMD